MKKLYLFANWKMYLDASESEKLARAFGKISSPRGSEVVVFPSAIAVSAVAPILKKNKLSIGAQNIHWADHGGFTGEISAAMYKDFGCTHALAGHSERRHLFHESDHDVRLKLEAILDQKMTPALCVGETLEERKAGKVEEVLERQLHSAYANLLFPKGIDLIVAYEPVWAIGTGESCDPKEAERVVELIGNSVKKLTGQTPVGLYGGSVSAENIRHYVDQPNIQGVLVGGASADKESWSALIEKLS